MLTYKISDDCIACGSCADCCPVECISEGVITYVINADECIACGYCADVCPVDAPVEVFIEDGSPIEDFDEDELLIEDFDEDEAELPNAFFGNKSID